MELELLFFFVVSTMALVALLMNLEHPLKKMFMGRFPALRRRAARFERKHPGLCDEEGTFYCFFRRDFFHRS